MAARSIKIRHDDETRAKIQVSQLINRLQDHVLGKNELSPTQIQAAQVLLKKALPDLVYQESHNTHEHVFAEVPKTDTPEQWQLSLVGAAGKSSPAPKAH